MLNLALGTEQSIGGRPHILTTAGASGHAIFGPYEMVPAGRHAVEFEIHLPDGADTSADAICAWIDVVGSKGHADFASDMVRTSQLAPGAPPVTLAFELAEATELEFRVFVNGNLPLLVADSPRLLNDAADVKPYPRPQFLSENRDSARAIFTMGGKVDIIDGHVIGEVKGVRFNARVYDDVNFVHEIFVLGAYNLLVSRPTCIIDVGLNVALASLVFATKPFIEEIHAFEPFEATRERGLANIALNPALARKITVNPYGLGDEDGELTLRIYDSGDSGAMSTRDSEYGTPMTIPMRDTGSALRPIVESARARGLEVIVKVDCEGSEFPVFASLAQSGLLSQIRGFMVEWHRVFEGRDQSELLAPLLANDYVVFDISPPTGNGFFYATRFD